MINFLIKLESMKPIFVILYREMYYRHIYASIQVCFFFNKQQNNDNRSHQAELNKGDTKFNFIKFEIYISFLC